MTDIYSILSSKPHNSHYLKRYWKFIVICQTQNISDLSAIHNHHICPKAKDLFPEYESFKENEWNRCALTIRQHNIAHHLLWKVYGGSQTYAFHMINSMSNPRVNKALDLDISKLHSLIATRENNKRVINGTHPAIVSSELGIHQWSTEKHSKMISSRNTQSARNGTHPAQRMVKQGTHYFQSDDHKIKQSAIISERNKSLNLIKARRDNVKELKNLAMSLNVKLPVACHTKSDNWINSKIQELGDIT